MKNLVTVSCLGRKGRWGNQVFQYCFARSYSRRYNIGYQVNYWVGQVLCCIEDSPIETKLPKYNEVFSMSGGRKNPDLNKQPWTHSLPPNGYEVIGKDFDGYAQFHTSYYQQHCQMLQRLFTPKPVIRHRLAPITEKLRRKTVIGLHLRRGDTGRDIFYLTPNEWYLQWLKENWNRFDNPQLVIATETPTDVGVFSEYSPLIVDDLLDRTIDKYQTFRYLQPDVSDPTRESMDWFPDWYLLTQCDVLLIGESTFGFTAAMMSQRIDECWQSKLSTQTFHRINPWDSYPLCLEHLDDYPAIPSTRYDSNPKYWSDR